MEHPARELHKLILSTTERLKVRASTHLSDLEVVIQEYNTVRILKVAFEGGFDSVRDDLLLQRVIDYANGFEV